MILVKLDFCVQRTLGMYIFMETYLLFNVFVPVVVLHCRNYVKK